MRDRNCRQHSWPEEYLSEPGPGTAERRNRATTHALPPCRCQIQGTAVPDSAHRSAAVVVHVAPLES